MKYRNYGWWGGGILVLGLLLWWGVNTGYLKMDLLGIPYPQGDITLLPQNYQLNPGANGELQLVTTQAFDKVSGFSLLINYSASKMAVAEVVTTGYKLDQFGIKDINTSDIGRIKISAVNSDGISFRAGDVLAVIKVQLNEGLGVGDQLTLALNDLEMLDVNLSEISATLANGTIVVGGGVVDNSAVAISAVDPASLAQGQDTTLTIRGQNFPTNPQVKVGNTTLTVSTATTTEIKALLPGTLATGAYDLTVFNGELSGTKTGAVTITAGATGLAVLSERSFFSPNKVRPNQANTDPDRETNAPESGTGAGMSTTLWVLVQNDSGVENIEYVDVNLQNIGGAATNRMQRFNNANGVVDLKQWYVLENITVPSTITPSTTPYQVRVTAYDKSGRTALGSVPVTVTNEVWQSLPPVVHNDLSGVNRRVLQTGPLHESLVFKTFVSDPDGAATLRNVTLDLTPLGLNVQSMEKVLGADNEDNVGHGYWFTSTVSSGSEISTQLLPGEYQLKILASDNSGMQGEGAITVTVGQVNAPEVLSDSYCSPKTVARDGKTEVVCYALVRDADGANDLQSVVADFSSINKAPITMDRVSVAGNGAWYQTRTPVTVATSVDPGTKNINIMATDSHGNSGSRTAELVVTEVGALIQNAPQVQTPKSYTVPNLVANDGKTEVTIYVLVTDPDGATDITSANVDLREINLDPVNVMTKGAAEGMGQWFTFKTKVPTTVAPSEEPYKLHVTATDAKGAIGEGYIPIRVQTYNPQGVIAPKLDAAVATDYTKVEVIFNKSLDRGSVSRDDFNIVDRNDVRRQLSITDVTMNSTGNVVILSTAKQGEYQPYTLEVVGEVRDSYNNRLIVGTNDKENFRGYTQYKKAPRIKMLTPISTTELEIDFDQALKPSSVDPQGNDFKIAEVENTNRTVKVESVEFVDEDTIRITTAPQTASKAYLLKVQDIANSNGMSVGKAGVNQMFRSYASLPNADLNQDGKIDFKDFTLFAWAYSQAQGYEEEPAPTSTTSTTASGAATPFTNP